MNIGGNPYKGRGSSSSKAIGDHNLNHHQHHHHNLHRHHHHNNGGSSSSSSSSSHKNKNKNNANNDGAEPPLDASIDTVGTLLAAIANAINDSLRLLMFADKTHWGPDEFEQVRALEDALDEAKEDFQQLGPLLKGSLYYENDRRPESIQELRSLRAGFLNHAQTFQYWLRRGGPIDPLWVNETGRLKRELRRAQRRAAARIFASQQADIAGGPGQRCLGAFEVYRKQRTLDERRKQYEQEQNWQRYESTRGEEAGRQQPHQRIPSWEQQTPVMGAHMVDAVEMGQMGKAQQYSQQPGAESHEAKKTMKATVTNPSTPPLEELVPACNLVGHFERFGDRDVAFACDYCDGFVVWEDLARMPTERDPSAVAAGVTEQPNWQAKGKSLSTAEDKTVVFAPLAIANHLPPDVGDWQARILCPFCDDYNYYEQGEEDDTKYAQDERGLGSLRELQEHLEWYHTSTAMPTLPSANCVVM
ncbi:hypothetical protein VSDG_01808 [Cytospora chrysosperma]|uniref:Uncharacterized protein n=1 Tax=Cytospora chrysosperma TaxID=252740 RepID=A0A423WHK4_CYTCH|nr:hypothetical protein VSDG_01808 [Valsa sordida]